MRATQPLPPRPLASDTDAPPSVALPWVTALIAWVCVSAVVLATAALHPGSMPAVSGRGLSGGMEWLCHLAMHTLPALLLPLGASGVDRILPRWPRLMRWAIGMGAMGGVIPLVFAIGTHVAPQLPQSMGVPGLTSSGQIACAVGVGALVGGLVGMVMGLFARRWRAAPITLPAVVAVLAYGLCWMRDDLVSPSYGVGVAGVPVWLGPGLLWMWLGVWPGAPWAPWALSAIMPAAMAACLSVARRRATASLPEGAVLPDDPRPSRRRQLAVLVIAIVLAALPLYRVTVQESRRRFIGAVSRHDLPAVGRWLRLGVSPNTWRAPHRRTALHIAAEDPDPALATRLLDEGADPNAALDPVIGLQGRPLPPQTPLQCAVERGSTATVRLLVDRGADPNLPSHRQGSVLGIAASREPRDLELMRYLLEHGADPDGIADRGNGFSALHVCVEEPEAVQLLLDYGADPNFQGRDRTPVGSALLGPVLCEGDLRSLRILLEHGGDPDRAVYSGSALYVAIACPPAVQLLLDYGADPNAPGGGLHDAARAKDPGPLRLLIAHGADVNARAYTEGQTPLHIAARKGRLTNAQILLQHGADARAVNNDGETPADLVNGEEDPELSRLLQSAAR